MRSIRIVNPMDYPLNKGESWYIVHPNNANVEFSVPAGGITVCTKDFYSFTANTVYPIVGDDPNNGWIEVRTVSEVVKMPYYVFARYFDAEAFVRGRLNDPCELEKAKPFDYKPTLPTKEKQQLELFEDNNGR